MNQYKLKVAIGEQKFTNEGIPIVKFVCPVCGLRVVLVEKRLVGIWKCERVFNTHSWNSIPRNENVYKRYAIFFSVREAAPLDKLAKRLNENR